jgi:hypothetical protein
MAVDLLGHSRHRPLASLSPAQLPVTDGVRDDSIDICRVAQGLRIGES